MRLLLVRHAKAGSRSDWEGDDRLRPITKSGRRQADGLVIQLKRYEVTRVLSSPYLRCVQTVEPLASALGLKVEITEALAEGCSDAALALVRSLRSDPSVVLSTHGDIVPDVLEALAVEDGLQLPRHPQWSKGSTWVLDRRDGRFAFADYLTPPA